MNKLRVDIAGLDLLLGGGIPLVRRAGAESAIVLLRGPPGSGKSIFGAQLAGAVAVRLGVDVAYGCVEILPEELREQHASFGRAGERVVLPPFSSQEQGQRRIFAASLDTGEAGHERAGFGGAVIELLDVVAQAGGKARVLVIDSLSDGYGLGAEAPRLLADQLCKVAVERGLILILLEETLDSRPSPWSFASDVVLDLEVQAPAHGQEMPADSGRRVTVRKNRFGPSDTGPHLFEIDPKRGVVLFPRPSAYLTQWAGDVMPALRGKPEVFPHAWSIPLPPEQEWPPFRTCVTAVFGPDAALVRHVVKKIGTPTENMAAQGVDIIVDFNLGRVLTQGSNIPRAQANAIDPYVNGASLMAEALRTLDAQHGKNRLVHRLIVGDFRSIRTYSSTHEIRRAFAVLARIFQHIAIPVILFETTAEDPFIGDVADVLVEVGRDLAIVTDVRGGHRYQWHFGPLAP